MPRPALVLNGAELRRGAGHVRRVGEKAASLETSKAERRLVLRPHAALRLGTVDAVDRLHAFGSRLGDEKIPLLLAGRFRRVLDLQDAVALKPFRLHPHTERPPQADNVPLPVRAVRRPDLLREGADTDVLRMPPPDLQEIGLGDGLFPVTHPDVVAVRELEIARRRVAQLEKGQGEVELQPISS